jgi:hypothetical protein
MFCHECDRCIGTGSRYVVILYGSGREIICLGCAVQMDWHSHGQPVYVAGQECRTCGEPTCHDCGGIKSRAEAGCLVGRHNRATAPYVLRSDHEHKRMAQMARAIRHRLDRLGARTRETESGRLVLA